MANSEEQDYAEFQAWQASKAAREAAELASRVTFPQVLHKIIDRIGFDHTGERDAAHAAVDREYPVAESADPAPPSVVSTTDVRNSDQGYAPLSNAQPVVPFNPPAVGSI